MISKGFSLGMARPAVRVRRFFKHSLGPVGSVQEVPESHGSSQKRYSILTDRTGSH